MQLQKNNQKLVALEGMPLSGKTSSWNYLNKIAKNDALFFDEIFFDESVANTLGNLMGNLEAQNWFFQQEALRQEKIATAQNDLIILDRTYLSTLAYTYARAHYTNNLGEFDQLVALYEEMKHSFPVYDHIFILDNEFKISHQRRKDKNKEQNSHWVSEKFMNYYREFYTDHAQKYTSANIIRLFSPDYAIKDLVAHVGSQVMEIKKLQASVVISIYNDELGLKNTLEQIEKQTYDTELFELVIVDNASTKDLKTFITQYQKKSQLTINFVSEPKIGLSNGRNTGVKKAKSNLILFTDANSIIDPLWLETMVSALNQKNVSVVGGKVINTYSHHRPTHLPSEIEQYFSPPDWPEKQIALKKPFYIIGANIGIKKHIFTQLGGFKKDLGRSGSQLLSCEDLELYLRVQKTISPQAVIIEPNAVITHVTEPKDYHFKQLLKKAFWQGVSEKRLVQYFDKNVLFHSYTPLSLIKEFALCILSLITFKIDTIILHLFTISKHLGYFLNTRKN